MRGNGPHPQPPLSRTVSCWAVGGEFGGRSPHQSARSIGRGWRGAFRCGRCSPLAARRLSWTAGQEQMVRARGEGRGGGGHCQPKAGAWVRRSWAMMGDAGARRSWAVMGRGGGGVGRAVTRPGINPRADPTKPLRGWARSPGTFQGGVVGGGDGGAGQPRRVTGASTTIGDREPKRELSGREPLPSLPKLGEGSLVARGAKTHQSPGSGSSRDRLFHSEAER
jgi:hypothetical protein